MVTMRPLERSGAESQPDNRAEQEHPAVAGDKQQQIQQTDAERRRSSNKRPH
jgi:hypothetical protein